jgi:diadenosine tetraphosphate (Ap4A) HIT family hydrolase
MQTYKRFKDLPWNNPLHEDVWYASFAPDEETDDYRIYVPKETTPTCLSAAFIAAYKVGEVKVGTGEWSAFSIQMNIGEKSNQIVGWPHLHLVPILA